LFISQCRPFAEKFQEQICIEWRLADEITDEINCAKFYFNRVKGFDFVGAELFWHFYGKKLVSPL